MSSVSVENSSLKNDDKVNIYLRTSEKKAMLVSISKSLSYLDIKHIV